MNHFVLHRKFFRLSLWASGVAVAGLGLLGPAPVAAQQIDVCVNFGSFALLPPPSHAGFLAKVQAYYTAAGLGPDDPQGVIFWNAAAPPVGGCDITANFLCDASLRWYGLSSKLTHSLQVNIYPFLGKFTTDPDPVGRRCQALAETLAHEVGHTLCGVHDCNGSGLKGTVSGADLPCTGAAATLMTVGSCVPCANRGIAPPLPGSRSLSAESTEQIRAGIIRLAAGDAPWDLEAEFDEQILRVVAGQAHGAPIPFGDELLRLDDGDVTLTYEILSGNERLFEFGWLNHRGDFIEPLPLLANPGRVLQAPPGGYLHFALRGRADCPFAGQVFRQKDFGTITLGGKSNAPANAFTPGVPGTYFSQATIEFNVSGNHFRVRLDTGDWGFDNGFYAIPPAQQPTVTLIPAGGVWRYLDNGTDQATAWRGLNFDDTSWASGPAELGFGDNPVTALNPGPTTNRFITYYFRHSFTLTTPACSNLLLRLKRDDGGIVYLNGTEVFRSQMPPGAVTAATLASAPAVNNQEEETFFQIHLPDAANLLQSGMNVVAVEVHQQSATSSDLSFDLELRGNVYPENAVPFIFLNFPANGARSQVGQNVIFSVNDGSVFDPDGTITRVEFYANAQLVASDTTRGFSGIWSNTTPGTYTLTALAFDNSGATTVTTNTVAVTIFSNTPPNVTLTAPANGSTFPSPGGFNVTATATDPSPGGGIASVDFRVDGASVGVDTTAPYGQAVSGLASGNYALTAVATDLAGLMATSPPVYVTVLREVATTQVSTGAVWRFFDFGQDPGPGWATPNFSDSSWREGPAELGYGENDEATLVDFGPDPSNKYITTYFRHFFNVSNPAVFSGLLLRLKRDDGGIVYLNGAEVFRSNMPTGAVNYPTLALVAAPDDGQTFLEQILGAGFLVPGLNLVAVEVHQSATNSSDLSFDFELLGLGVGQPLPGIFNVNASVGGTVNGQPVSASATGSADTNSGKMTLDWTINSVPTGYSVWGSIYTKAGSVGSGTGHAWANAFNLLQLSGGNYSIHEVAVFSGSGLPVGGVVTADVIVSRNGDTLTSQSTLNGEVNLPPLVGIVVEPGTWTPLPGGNQFLERATKYLLRQDGGEPIRADTQATFTLAPGAVLPRPQARYAGMTVLTATPNAANPTSSRIEYQNSVAPGQYLNGLLATPLGTASLAVGPSNAIVVNNLPFGGTNGVTIGLDAAEYFETAMVPLSLTSVGASLTLGASGHFNNAPGTFLGTASLSRSNAGTLVRANFDPIGGSLARVEMYSNGVPAGGYTLPTGLLGTITSNVVVGGCGKEPTDPFPPSPPCYWLRFNQPVDFSVPGLPRLVGTEMRILAINAPGSIRQLTGFSIQAGGVPNLALTRLGVVDPADGAKPAGFRYTHVALLNGQKAVAQQTGLFQAHGVLALRATIDRYIPGYEKWPASILTLATHSGCPIDPCIVSTARSLQDLTGGNLGHQVRVVGGDAFASLTTHIYVRRHGPNAVATLVSEGTANYPMLKGMRPPLVYQQTPNAGGGFTETGTKLLLAEDGSTVSNSFNAQFLGTDPLPAPQQRSTLIEPIFQSPDCLNVELRITGLIKPAALANPDSLLVRYQHNYSINGQNGVATASGLGDRATGLITTHAQIGDFVIGYEDPRWSPVTLQVISVVSSLARELGLGRNTFSLTGGALGHTVRVNTRDQFANIDTFIRVTRAGDVLLAQLDSTGTADYPPGPATMQSPLVLTQTPNPGGGFTETTRKHLTAADGTPVESVVTAVYSGVNLSNPQTRVVNVTELAIAPDRHSIDLQFQAVVQPDTGAVFINEWLANPDPPLTDYIELYNVSGAAVLLTGFSLTDDFANPTKFLIPSGTLLQPNEYRAFNQAQLGFGLNANGAVLGLFAANGAQLVDTVSFGPQASGVSQGRCPNGSATIVTLPARSPGAPNTCPDPEPAVTFQGVTHRARGNATLQLVSTQLVVGNIGSSGNDGVAVELGAAQFGTVTFERQDPNALPTGATLTMRALGTVNGRDNQLIATLRATDVGTDTEYWCDFGPIGAVAATALVYDGPNVVAQVSNVVGTVARITGVIPCDIWDPVWPMGGRPWALIDFPSRPSISLIGGATVAGTRLVVIPQPVLLGGPDPEPAMSWWPFPEPWDPYPHPWDPMPHPWGTSLFSEPEPQPYLLGSLSRLEILGRNVGQVRLTRTEIGQFHHAHNAVGAVSLLAEEGSLLIGGIPPTGANGIDIRLDPVDRFGVRFANPDPQTAAPVGAFLQASARGSLVGGADQFLGSLEVRKNAAGALAITPNYTAINSTRQRVEIVRNGVVVSTTFGSNATVATVPSWPGGCRKEGPPIIVPTNPPILCIWWEWPVNVNFMLAGGGVVSGNQIRVLADNAPVALNHLSLFSLRAGGGLTNLRLVGEEPGNSGLYFQGVAHLPLGSATLQTVSSQLVVGNIGASGSNGVSLALGDAGFGVVTFDRLDANTLPTGANIHMRAFGTVDGVPNRFLGTLRATDVGTAVQYWCDFGPIGATRATALVYDGPNVVARRDNLVGPVATVPGAVLCDPWDPVWPHDPRTIWAIIGFPDRPLITLTGGTAVRGDRLVVIPRGPDPQPDLPTVTAVSRLDILGRNVGTFRVIKEQVGQFHQLNQALGQARLFGVGDDLRLNNLYSAANNPDGVEITLNDADSFSALWRPLAAVQAPPTGSVLRASARGAFGGGAERLLGSVQLTDVGPTKQIAADYSPIGAFSRRVEVVRDGVVIATLHGVSGTGVVARVPDWPVGCGKTGPPWRPPILCFWWRWWPQTPFDLGNGQVVIGDELRILAENPSAPLDYLSSFSLQAAGIPEINFVSEQSARSGVHFGGLAHTRLGGAQLAVDISNGFLLVAPPAPGATGAYGARIELGAAQFNIVQFDPGSAASLPSGAFLRVSTEGELDGVPNQLIWSIKTEDVGGQFGLSFDAARVRAGSVRVEARLGSQIVDTRVFSPPPAASQIIVTYPVDGCWIDPFWPMPPECWAILALATPGPVTLLGRPPVIADRIVVATVAQQATVGSLSATLMEASQVPAFRIYDQALGMFGLPHRATGAARLLGVNETLRVSNIGSSGEDGVDVELDRAHGFATRWFDLDPRGLVPAGSHLELSARGAYGGRPEQCVGLLRVTDLGATKEVTADYTPVGVTTRRLEVFNAGQPVAIVTGNTGWVARVPDWPDGCGKRAPIFPPFPPILCYWIGWEGPVAISLGAGGGPGLAGVGQTVMGDELRVLAENAPGPLDYLSEYSLRVAGIPEITLLPVSAPSSMPDTDGDGMPDAWELLYGLNPNDPSDASLDNDNDGHTNLQEYLACTDPLDPASVLSVLSIVRSGANVIFAFTAGANCAYTVEGKNDLGVPGGWNTVLTVPSAPTNRLINVTVPLDSPARFFRIRRP